MLTKSQFYLEWLKRSFSGRLGVLERTAATLAVIGAGAGFMLPDWATVWQVLMWAIPLSFLAVSFGVGLIKSPYDIYVEKGTSDLHGRLEMAEARATTAEELLEKELAVRSASRLESIQRLLREQAAKAEEPYTYQRATDWFAATKVILDELWLSQEWAVLVKPHQTQPSVSDGTNSTGWKIAGAALQAIAARLTHADCRR